MPKPPNKPSEPHTAAYITLERNLDSVRHLLALASRETAVLKAAFARTKRVSGLVIEQIGLLKTGEATSISEELAKLKRSIGALAERLKSTNERWDTVARWQVVILVTAIETYLKDVLKAAAKVEPELMNKSEQPIRYIDLAAFSSIEDLADDMRSRWARGWVDDGGPKLWIERLCKMGARGLADDLPSRMERFWGIRHVIVHSAGAATIDFVRRHPGVVKAPGDQVPVTRNDFGAFLTVTNEFVEPTDAFFLKRFPALVVLLSSSADIQHGDS